MGKVFCSPKALEDDPSSPSVPRASLTPERKKQLLARREKILDEFVATEVTYIDGLNRLQKDWIDPLDQLVDVTEEYPFLWSNLSAIMKLHNMMIPELKKNKKKLAEVMLGYADFLKVYSQFIREYPTTLQTIDAICKKKKKAREFFDEKRSKGLTVQNLLITPIQRIPRYLLLLKDLDKNYEKSLVDKIDPDRQCLRKTIAKIKTIADHLNEANRDIENASKFLEISNRIRGRGGSIWKPSRRFIAEQAFVQKKKGLLKRDRTYRLFLFTDCLMLTTDAIKYKYEWPLTYIGDVGLVVPEAQNSHTLPPSGNQHGIRFNVLDDEGKSIRQNIMWTAEASVAEKWVQMIASHRDELVQSFLKSENSVLLLNLPSFYYEERESGEEKKPLQEQQKQRPPIPAASAPGSPPKTTLKRKSVKKSSAKRLLDVPSKRKNKPKRPPPDVPEGKPEILIAQPRDSRQSYNSNGSPLGTRDSRQSSGRFTRPFIDSQASAFSELEFSVTEAGWTDGESHNEL